MLKRIFFQAESNFFYSYCTYLSIFSRSSLLEITLRAVNQTTRAKTGKAKSAFLTQNKGIFVADYFFSLWKIFIFPRLINLTVLSQTLNGALMQIKQLLPSSSRYID